MSHRAPPPQSFHHSSLGTSEPEWLLEPRWDDVPATSVRALLADVGRLVVLAAHPDDESLGAGALIADAVDAGVPVTLVVASDGARSHPHAGWPQGRLAAMRRSEMVAAALVLAGADSAVPEPDSARSRALDVVHLTLPDGALADHVEEMAAAVVAAATDGRGPSADSLSADSLSADAGRATLVLSPWSGDGHPDHVATAAAARSAAHACGARVAGFPVWFWHWGVPDELPWDRVQLLDPSLAALERKSAAVACHRSQIAPLGPDDGQQAVLGPHVLARFGRAVEVLVHEEAAPAAGPRAAVADTFDAMYDAGADPWDAGSWYERRKRRVVLASLARERYERVLDLGCATGALTRELAARAEVVHAVDVSTRALEVARAASAREPTAARITWHRGRSPEVLAELHGPFDLVVLSEVGYFLAGSELLGTLRGLRRLLAPDGELVLVHWRHPTRDIPLDGPTVHRQAAAVLDLPRRVHYADDDVLVDVYGGRVR